MKTFRRVLFYLLCAIILISFVIIELASHLHVNAPFLPACALIASLFALLVWCAVFLRVEPTLTRVALIILLISFCIAVFLGAQVET